NMDVIKTADWIIDVGPDGGSFGGEIIAEANPEEIAKQKTATGIFLKSTLEEHFQKEIKKLAKNKNKKKKEAVFEEIKSITVLGAEQNNLKNLDVSIPRGKIIVCTGPSGSGKSSFAFETIYAEGQRRYIESLSPYARQFVKQMPKPKVASVSGLSPAIAIEQKAHAGNPRSTIGTMTESYDYLRILYARLGTPHDPETGEVIKAISKEHVVQRILSYPEGEKIQILAPIEIKKNETFENLIFRLKQLGFVRIRLNGQIMDLDQPIENFNFDKKRKNEFCLVIDRLKVGGSIENRLYEAIENAASFGQNKLIVMMNDEDIFFNLSFAVESTGKSYPEITPHTFSFNNPEGMCLDCLGLGFQYGANLAEKEEIMDLSILSFAKMLWNRYWNAQNKKLLLLFLEAEKIDPYTPLSLLKKEKLHLLMNGSPDGKFYQSPAGFNFRWAGISEVFAKAGKAAHAEIKERIIPLLEEHSCPSCDGTRLNPLARNVTIDGVSIADVCRMPLSASYAFIEKLKLNAEEEKLLEEVHTQLKKRISFLLEVGLHYIQLERKAPTLSGGEAQRIRLARQLGSGLTGALYVLDEPTIGLHPHDNARLNRALKNLKELGNTLILVEHDPLTIAEADYILDFGPKSGVHGGHITAKGSLKEILRNKNSLTGAYLSGKLSIPVPKRRPIFKKGAILIENASLNNLKNISCQIPVGALTCITGVSGSGKSTLINQILLPAIQKALLKEDVISLNGTTIKGISHFDKLISIDQNPIGHTVRSDVGTYVDLLARMREFFASLPAAKMKGFQGAHFSYNHRKGMCPSCFGLGYRRIEMLFLPEVKIECEDCKGMRLNSSSLEVSYQSKNFGQWLNTTIDEARIAFENHPRIVRILDTLIAVGLGYLKIGQETASLSGGEAQRIKLSRELAKRSSSKTLYLLDEPTTGLHSDDIAKLLTVLQKLTDKGNTMIIIEHHLDVIKNADYIIDLGPEAGIKGGHLVFAGTPEEIINCNTSYTGQYLKECLK
ncbi:MAG TPA: excinuclease ABC subunit UvrA, partial [Parachlamydiaceae bacterium]|nr:excinuclease ABC subunit UvrA [Parachlamydiaceae bacterium]